jgi:uncharacterized membrane protein
MKLKVLAALCAAFCLIFTVHAAPASAHGHGKHFVRVYKATLLLNPESQEPFVARDLNNRGEVAGSIKGTRIHGPNFSQAAIWRHGRVVQLENFYGQSIDSGARAINDFGDAVGSDGSSTVTTGVFWDNGVPVRVGSDEGEFHLFPKRLNNRGTVIAISDDNYSFVWNGGSFGPLLPDGHISFPEDINNAGNIVGWDNGPTGTRALLWRDGTVEALTTPPGMTDAQATGIDDFDHVVGFALDSATGIQRAFFWRHGEMKKLPLVRTGDKKAAALAINTWDQVVGNEESAGSSLTFAVLWERGRAIDLNFQIKSASALYPHITLRSAFRINEWGQILVSAQDDRVADEELFYLLTPTYEWR